MERIYEDAKDLHVKAVKIYAIAKEQGDEPTAYWDKEGLKALSRDEMEDAFIKGCVIVSENDGGYARPTSVSFSNYGSASLHYYEGSEKKVANSAS